MLTLFGFCYRFINRAYKQERTFRQVVMLAFNDFPEATNGFFNRHVLTLHAGELLGYTERL